MLGANSNSDRRIMVSVLIMDGTTHKDGIPTLETCCMHAFVKSAVVINQEH